MRLFRDFNDFADPFSGSLLRGQPLLSKSSHQEGPRFGAMDIHETADGHEIVIDAPGLAKSDFRIDVTPERVLRVSGERKTFQSNANEAKENGNSNSDANGNKVRWQERTCTSFSRSVRLPAEADEDKIKANAKDGVLKIYIPSIPKPAPVSIPVE